MPGESDPRAHPRIASNDVYDDLPAFTPRIEARDVFFQLIAEEVRSGRLSPARRRRIVRYAARLGLSAVEVGRMVTACRKDALASSDPTERRHALRLIEPPPERVAAPLKIALIVLAALVVNLLLIRWFWP